MLDVRSTLNEFGILDVRGLYGADDIAAINSALDPHFARLSDQHRSYAFASDLMGLGISETILSDRLVSSLFELIADPILYHFHVYEIEPRQNESHIEATILNGWHRDFDSSYTESSPSHLSLFVYLSDVGDDDGPFEFIPEMAKGRFRNDAPAIRKRGRIGDAFFWNRYYLHRASPNRGHVRRRVLKISVQKSSFPSSTLVSGSLRGVAATMKTRDAARSALFGHHSSEDYPSIVLKSLDILYSKPEPNMTAHVNPLLILKAQAREVRMALMPGKSARQAAAQYE